MRGRGYAEERLQKLQVARDCPSIVRDAMLVLQVGQSPPAQPSLPKLCKPWNVSRAWAVTAPGRRRAAGRRDRFDCRSC